MPIEPFTYNGVERLSLDILENTPTPTGLLFGMVACFFLSWHLVLGAGGSSNAAWAVRVGVFAAYLFFVVLTALTYSRGAWAALLVALLSLLLALRIRVKHSVALVAITALVFLCIPQGVSRAASFGDVRSDKAIANRLELWQGTSHLIADNPLFGVGLDKIGIEYQKYWQPFGKGSRYFDAVNLPLTLYAGCGAVVFALYALGTIVSLRFSYMLMRGGRDILSTWFFSAVICFTIANLFATIYDTIIIFPLLGLAPLIIYHAFARFRPRELFRHWGVMLAIFVVVMATPFGVSRLSGRAIIVEKYPTHEYSTGIHAERIMPATDISGRAKPPAEPKAGDDANNNGSAGGFALPRKALPQEARASAECAIVWCDASDRLSSARGIRLGRLACASGLEALVIQGVNMDFTQTWTMDIVTEFSRGRPMILCADGPVVFGMHEKLIPRMASPDKNLLGTICIYEESGHSVASVGEDRNFKPANITVFLDDPNTMEAMLLKSYMEKRTRNVFLNKDFPDYEEELLAWIRSARDKF